MKIRTWQLRVGKFLAAGGVGVALYYIVLYTLTEFAHVWYLASAVAASILNYGTNFVLQKFWTFEDKDTDKRTVSRQAVLYALMVISFFVLNLGLLYAMVEYFRLWYMAAQVISTILLTVLSFLLTSRIFAKPQPP